MHEKLLIDAYKKAEKDEGLRKKTHITEFLSDFIIEDSGTPYGEKILRIHYNNAINNNGEKAELKIFAVNSLCKYLGYDSFSDYEKKEPGPSFSTTKTFFIKNRIKIILTFALVSAVIIMASFTIETQKWMVWKNDHYEEVQFDIEKYNIRELKVYNKKRILSFRKTIPDCQTIYFKPNGHENLWYGKNVHKELEFYTTFGLHPETGKTLKPITEYMIKKYICNSYKK